MKARIFEIKRFAVHDGDGIRTTVFFKGCPLRCVWCHNPEGLAHKPQLAYYAHKCISCGECAAVCPQTAQKMHNGIHFFERERCTACGNCANTCPVDALHFYGREVTVEELLPPLLEDRPFYETSGGGVTLSGGECLMQADFCATLLCALKSEGISTAVEEDIITRLSNLVSDAYRTTETLKAEESYAASIPDACTRAAYYCDKVLPLMSELRAAVDGMEVLTASDLWPVPTYGDLMFRV